MATFHENLVQSFTNFKNKYITPIQTALNNKQGKTDNTLGTTSKTIVGAINEINSNISDLTAEIISTPTDFNILTLKEKYIIETPNCPNSPDNVHYGILLVGKGTNINNNDYYIEQLYFSDDGTLYMRVHASNAWLNWKSISIDNYYGTSSTVASTTAKTATTTDAAGRFALTTGAKVSIKFTYNNTASAPTLNVDSTGAKSIKAYGTTAPTIWWQAGDIVTFIYDGTNWIMGATQGQISNIGSIVAVVDDTDTSIGWHLLEQNSFVIGNLVHVCAHVRAIQDTVDNTKMLTIKSAYLPKNDIEFSFYGVRTSDKVPVIFTDGKTQNGGIRSKNGVSAGEYIINVSWVI